MAPSRWQRLSLAIELCVSRSAEYKLAILKELLRNYALDGLFLDWIRTGDVRDNPQTDAEGVANSGYEEPLLKQLRRQYGVDAQTVPNGDERWVRLRAEPQTEFMRAAHKLVSAQKRRLPVCALVGHPWHYRGEQNKIDGNLRGLLLDVRPGHGKGSWMQLWRPVLPRRRHRRFGLARSEAGDGSQNWVWTYGWVPQGVADFERDFALAKTLGGKQILFWEADYIDDRPNAAELKAAMSRCASAAW